VNEIPELGNTNTSNNSQGTGSEVDSDAVCKEDNGCNESMEFLNGPFITWSYTNHKEQTDIVCVAVAVFSGSEDIHFNLSEDGMNVLITYTWPEPLYTPSFLYKKKIDTGVMATDHPEIHSFANRIAECELSAKAKPKGHMSIRLPVRVQRQVGSWSKEGLKCKESNIILLKFSAYQKKRVIQDADTSISNFS
jgi:hypothetical protein